MNLLAHARLRRLSVANRLKWSVIAFLSALLISGCGGGSSSGSGSGNQPTSSTTVSGIVTDPAIEGSAVRLVDSEGDVLTRIVRTGADGTFEFEVSDAQLASLAEIVAVGGRDVETGADLTGITLRARANGAGDFVVSPVTTLSVEASGSMTREQLASLMGLDSVDALIDDPANNDAIQVLSLKLTDVVLALQDEGFGWSDLVNEIQLTDGDLATATENLAEDNSSPLLAVAVRLRALDAASGDEGMTVVERWNLLRIEEGLASFYRDSLNVTVEGEAAEAVSRIAQTVWEGADRKGAEPDSPGVLNLARYLVTGYGLDGASLTADLVVPSEIETDELIAFVISTDFIDHQLPLADGERLTDGNAARAQYFLQSDLSPFFRAENLFKGVFDDSVTDPVYSEIALGLYAAGLNTQADRTVRSKIFQPYERAEAFRDAGLALFNEGQVELAKNYWNLAAETLDTIVAKKGLNNLSFDDTRLAQNLSINFGLADLDVEAQQVLSPLLEFRERFGGPENPWSGNYFNLTTGLVELAEDLVASAEEAGLNGPALQRALDATNLAARWVDDMPGPQPGPITCAAIQSQYTARYMNLYSRLGENERALEGVNKFEATLALDCNSFASFYIDIGVPTYGQLGLNERLRDLATGVPYPSVINAVDIELATFNAVEAARASGGAAAIAAMEDGIGGLQDRFEAMVFGLTTDRGTFSFLPGTLAERLLLAGLDDAATEVSDAAWELVTSGGFRAQATDPDSLILRGCRAGAIASDVISSNQIAIERMEECSSIASSTFDDSSSTQQRFNAQKQIAEGFISLGSYRSEPLNRAKTQAALISEPSTRLTAISDVALLQAEGNELSGGLQTLDQSVIPDLNSLSSGAVSVDETEAFLDQVMSVAETYNDLVDIARTQVSQVPVWSAEDQGVVEQSRLRVRELIDGGLASIVTFGGVLSLLDGLDEDGRVDQRMAAVEILAQARHYDFAETIARDSNNPVADRDEMLADIAGALTGADDFPGVSIARYDYDGDGYPDFFNPASSQSERDQSPLTVDDDIDGDDIPDTIDPTPYCSTCEGG